MTIVSGFKKDIECDGEIGKFFLTRVKLSLFVDINEEIIIKKSLVDD
jgi:hypothetical protein